MLPAVFATEASLSQDFRFAQAGVRQAKHLVSRFPAPVDGAIAQVRKVVLGDAADGIAWSLTLPTAQVPSNRATELATPRSDRLVGHGDAPLGEQVLDAVEAQGKPVYSHTAQLMI